MEYRILGKTGLKLSLLGVGCNRISAAESASHEREIEATLCAAIDRGINVFDTADVYGAGDSERLIGRILRGRRSEFHICTKAGLRMGSARRYAGKVTPRIVKRILHFMGLMPERRSSGKRSSIIQNYEPDYIEASIRQSLYRLKTDYLDIFLLHSPPPETVRESALFESLANFKQKKMIRYYGVSMSDKSKTEDAIAFLDVEGLSVLQIMANSSQTMDVGKVVSLSVKKGVGVIIREPFLRGKIFSSNRLQELAAHSDRFSLAQMAIRAAVQIDGVSSVIVGMRSRSHLDENLSALSKPPLSKAQMEVLYPFAGVY